jgi:hypothetical protein
MDWRELWRLRSSDGTDGTPPPTASPVSDVWESSGAADLDSDERDAVRTRFFFVVARTRLDLFLTIRRQFRDDRTVYVMLDRREQERRGKPGPLEVPDRRLRPDRRRPVDYWEDTGHHPAVLIPLARLRQPSDPPPPADAPQPDKEPTMERVFIDEARMLAWIQEGQHVFQHVLPAVIDERDVLRRQLQESARRCEELQRENDGLRADVARATADHRQLEQGHADIVDSVGQFLSQLTHVLEPMRTLAEKLGQGRHRPGGVDRIG